MSIAPELSRPVPVGEVGAGPISVDVVASETERRALARRFGLAALDDFVGRVRLRRASAETGAVIRVDLDFEAAVVQHCVVTLEPVPARLVETGLVAEFEAADSPVAGDLLLDWIDLPEPIDGDAIDVGELLAQHLGLALDLYPRAPGARLDAPADGDAHRPHPFSALAALREKPGDGD